MIPSPSKYVFNFTACVPLQSSDTIGHCTIKAAGKRHEETIEIVSSRFEFQLIFENKREVYKAQVLVHCYLYLLLLVLLLYSYFIIVVNSFLLWKPGTIIV